MFGGGRRQNHETGTISGDTGDIGHKEALLWLQRCRVIITRMCLLVSCPRHHATCRLQTHCRPPADCLILGKYRKELLNEFQRTTYFHFCPFHYYITGHVRARVTCLVTTCHMSWAEQGLDTGLHLSAVFITHYHYLSEILNIAHTQHQIVLNWTCFAKKVNII